MEKAMAPHSSTLAWKIPWTEEPGGLQSTGSLRVGHDWATSLSLSCIGDRNGNPLQCSCLENPRDGGAWWAAIYGVAQSQTQLKRLNSSSSSRRNKGITLNADDCKSMSIFIDRQVYTLIPDINLILNISQFTWIWNKFWPVTFCTLQNLYKHLISLSQLNRAHWQISFDNTIQK